jgi:hypothetical protein
MRQILWGLFKKIVIADNCAVFANQIFNNSADLNGSTLVLGALFFAFQIYGDFSGYSDIAIGTSRLFGFNLMRNFDFPYFSRDIAEFWRRWHISLSTWFRDYLYIPLGGESWRPVSETQKHAYHIHCEWFLAWGKLDVHRLGSIECFVLPATPANQQKPEQSGNCSKRQTFTWDQSVVDDVNHLRPYGLCLDFFQSRKHQSCFQLHFRDLFCLTFRVSELSRNAPSLGHHNACRDLCVG